MLCSRIDVMLVPNLAVGALCPKLRLIGLSLFCQHSKDVPAGQNHIIEYFLKDVCTH